MSPIPTNIKVKAPGRICLFGEHQDYLGFTVIAAAINRYIFINGKASLCSQSEAKFAISMPDLENVPKINLMAPSTEHLLEYTSKRDYLKSGLNVAAKNGAHWTQNWEIQITGNIPINAGASSSSAMVIAWLLFLSNSSGINIQKDKLGVLGYETEVAEFKEAGGMMDHFASAFGRIIFVESRPKFRAEYLSQPLSGFVLANSGKKKNTVDDLRRVKSHALEGFAALEQSYPKFNRFTTSFNEICPYLDSIPEKLKKITQGNLINRDLTQKALSLLGQQKPFTRSEQSEFGQMILRHHEMLSQNVGISIPEIDDMVQIALKAGALGGKINGSGFGGTMFAYAPENHAKVCKALKEAGYDAWEIDISEGAKIY